MKYINSPDQMDSGDVIHFRVEEQDEQPCTPYIFVKPDMIMMRWHDGEIVINSPKNGWRWDSYFVHHERDCGWSVATFGKH